MPWLATPLPWGRPYAQHHADPSRCWQPPVCPFQIPGPVPPVFHVDGVELHVARGVPELIPTKGHDFCFLAQFLSVHPEHAVHDREDHILVPEVGRTVVVPRHAWVRVPDSTTPSDVRSGIPSPRKANACE
eukprot:2045185-Alexandrium_andersonii.AAC.1